MDRFIPQKTHTDNPNKPLELDAARFYTHILTYTNTSFAGKSLLIQSQARKVYATGMLHAKQLEGKIVKVKGNHTITISELASPIPVDEAEAQ